MEEAKRKDYLQRCGLRVGGEDTGAKKSRKLSPPLSVKGQGEGVAARIWPELRLWKKAPSKSGGLGWGEHSHCQTGTWQREKGRGKEWREQMPDPLPLPITSWQGPPLSDLTGGQQTR